MPQLDEALDCEIQELETVLLRLTTLRLLMATGKHQLVDRAVMELEMAMDAHDDAEKRAVHVIETGGFTSLADAVAAHAVEERADLDRRAAQVRALHRDVRVALATTNAVAQRSAQNAVVHLGGVQAKPIPRRRAGNPFITGD